MAINIVTLSASSLRQLVRTLPDSDRQDMLIIFAEQMLTQTDANREPCSQMWIDECLSDIGEACKYYSEQADNLLSGT